MYCWLLLQIYLCYLWLLLCSRVTYLQINQIVLPKQGNGKFNVSFISLFTYVLKYIKTYELEGDQYLYFCSCNSNMFNDKLSWY